MSDTNFPLVPMHDMVIVEKEQAETTTAGGIVLTGSSIEDTNDRGIVRAVGPGRVLDNGERVETTVKVGDRIVWAANTGNPIKLGEDDNEYMVMVEQNIIGILVGGEV